jgi:hypothetical protein
MLLNLVFYRFCTQKREVHHTVTAVTGTSPGVLPGITITGIVFDKTLQREINIRSATDRRIWHGTSHLTISNC